MRLLRRRSEPVPQSGFPCPANSVDDGDQQIYRQISRAAFHGTIADRSNRCRLTDLRLGIPRRLPEADRCSSRSRSRRSVSAEVGEIILGAIRESCSIARCRPAQVRRGDTVCCRRSCPANVSPRYSVCATMHNRRGSRATGTRQRSVRVDQFEAVSREYSRWLERTSDRPP